MYLNVFIIRHFKINNNKNLSKAFNFTVFLFLTCFQKLTPSSLHFSTPSLYFTCIFRAAVIARRLISLI